MAYAIRASCEVALTEAWYSANANECSDVFPWGLLRPTAFSTRSHQN